jgi:uncharacterized protein
MIAHPSRAQCIIIVILTRAKSQVRVKPVLVILSYYCPDFSPTWLEVVQFYTLDRYNRVNIAVFFHKNLIENSIVLSLMVQTRIVQSQPALVLEDKKRYLVVTDLHIGFENSLVANDIHIDPKELVHETTSNLESIIESQKPDSLILLGDVKTSIDSISKIEWQAVQLFFDIGKKIETIVIPGNHDGNIQKLVPEWVSVTSSSGLVIDDVLLTHGHVMPTENLSQVNRIIMGHVHPVYFQEGSVLDGQRVWVSIKAEKKQIFPSTTGKIEIIVIPSFNKYFYATQKRYYKKSISPIIENIRNFDSAKIVTLDGSIIGNESMMQNVL